MMFDEIWVSSQHNAYSWIMPTILGVGFVAMVATGWIRRKKVRVDLRLVLFVFLLGAAMWASSLQIEEKWRLRRQWAKETQELTDDQRAALSADGANLLLGPVLVGTKWGVLVLGAGVLLSAEVARIRSRASASREETADTSSPPADAT